MEFRPANPTTDTMEPQTGADADHIQLPAMLSLAGLFILMWQNKRSILLITVVVAACAVAYSYVVTPVFTATVTMLPQQRLSSVALPSHLANLLPRSFGSELDYESLYPQIVVSDLILEAACTRSWRFMSDADSASLYEIFGLGGNSPGAPSRKDMIELKKILREKVISLNSDRLTGFMTLQVNAPRDPVFASNFANFLASELDVFLRDLKSTKSTEQQLFTERRLDETQKALDKAEAALLAFEEENRAIASSPALLSKHRAFQREVDAQAVIWVELRKQLELAVLNNNRDKVSIDVLDTAKPPVLRSSPIRRLYLVIGVLLGFALSIVVLLGRYFWGRLRTTGTPYLP